MTLPACDRIIELTRDNYEAVGIQPDAGRAPAGLDARMIHEWSAAQRRRNWRDEIVTLTPKIAAALNAAHAALTQIANVPTPPKELPTMGQGLTLAYERIAREAIAKINELLARFDALKEGK